MKIDTETKRGREYIGGNEILRYKISVPITENCERINEFYKRIAEDCEEFCRSILPSICEGRSVYILESAPTHVQGGEVAFLMRIRLMSEGKLLDTCVISQVWDTANERMISPSRLRKKYFQRGKKRGEKITKGRDILLHNGRILDISRTDIDRFFK